MAINLGITQQNVMARTGMFLWGSAAEMFYRDMPSPLKLKSKKNSSASASTTFMPRIFIKITVMPAGILE